MQLLNLTILSLLGNRNTLILGIRGCLKSIGRLEIAATQTKSTFPAERYANVD